MLRAQQAYFLENHKFSSNLKDLQLGIKSETESYSFRVIPQGNQKKQVMMTVTAKKPELNSYTGVVYIVKNKQEAITMTAICETEKPSITAPTKPKIPTKLSEKVQCPADSRSSY
jgi:Type IV pilin-like G and H, putative